jgi:hypothetical protein
VTAASGAHEVSTSTARNRTTEDTDATATSVPGIPDGVSQAADLASTSCPACWPCAVSD